MAKSAYFRIEHKSFNRDEWGYGRVAAHAHYAANENKRGIQVGVNIPLFDTSYETEAYVKQLEMLNRRKNARLGDTLIVSLPRDVSEPHRLIMMERFLGRITFGGQTYARAWEHTDKAHNPHFHVVLIDRHHETGKSVGKFGHSRSYRKKLGLEPNVTEWMRMQWEQTGNEVFAEFGYSLSFDRRSNLAQGIEKAGIHRGHGNDNADARVAPEVPDNISDEPVEDVHSPPDEDAVPPEPDDDPRITSMEVEDSPAGAVRFIHTQVAHLEYLQRAQERLDIAKAQYQGLVAERERASEAAGAYYSESLITLQNSYAAQARLTANQNGDGSLKGRSFSLFGRTLFKTGARKTAELAQQEAEALAFDAQAVLHKRQSYDRIVSSLSHRASQAERDAFALQAELQDILGDQKDMAEAERLLRSGIRHAGKSVTIEAAYDAFEGGELTLDEYRTFLIQGGFSEELKLLDDHHSETYGGASL